MKPTYVAVVAAVLFVAAGAAASLADTSSANVLVSKTKAYSGMAALTTSGSRVADAMADFGSPPSGEVPILFNDRHVYANPDTLRQGRVLAALVKNGTLLVPLRSMFEQMGATVSYDGASKSVKATKPGSQVQVTLGKNEVLINGESRPLDVPPMMYKGSLLVPVRVISEALGAYVQWVPEQHVCVVRYIPPTPVPTPAPPVATPVPTPAPTTTPAPLLGFIQGGYNQGRVYNEYAAGVTTKGSNFVGAGALLFNPIAIKVDFRQDQYLTTPNAASSSGAPLTQFNTIDGGTAFAPQFQARQSTLDGRLEYKIASPQIYIGGSYVQATNNYGSPRLTGAGGGLEKLPDFQSALGWFGSAFYYPQIKGNYTVPFTSSPNFGKTYSVSYQLLKYDVGIYYGTTIYAYLGYSGDRYTAKTNAPISQTHSGPYIGLGIRF